MKDILTANGQIELENVSASANHGYRNVPSRW